MSAHNIHLQDKENHPKLSVYRIWKKSLRTRKRVRLIHDKRAIGVRAIEVLLYIAKHSNYWMLLTVQLRLFDTFSESIQARFVG